jgi:hypothetical protein
MDVISHFVQASPGLVAKADQNGTINIVQKVDGKSLDILGVDIEEVISRLDSDGQGFLQINFLDGQKILLTQRLIGFKPAPSPGLDMSKLPKVVTTPDLISVVEAIEDNLNSESAHPIELDILRKVFDSVVSGGEAIGFDLAKERDWLHRLSSGGAASA